MHPPSNVAPQSSHASTITQPAVHEYIFIHQDHAASNEQTLSDYVRKKTYQFITVCKDDVMISVL